MPGARVHPDGRLSRSARERVAGAAALHRAGWAPRVLLTGGNPDGPVNEADRMALEALRLGVPEAALLLEPLARNTWENADYSAAVLRRHRLTSAIVVTHPFHTRRVKRTLLRRGILVIARPIEGSWMEAGGLRALELVLREYVALAVDLTGGRR